MPKTKQDFELFQGVHKTVEIAVVDDDENALNMAGYTDLTWVITLAGEKTTALVTKVPTIISIDATNDGLQFEVLPANTATLKGEYYHEARGVSVSGKSAVVSTGTLTIIESATG